MRLLDRTWNVACRTTLQATDDDSRQQSGFFTRRPNKITPLEKSTRGMFGRVNGTADMHQEPELLADGDPEMQEGADR